jgi:hypothetical protein
VEIAEPLFIFVCDAKQPSSIYGVVPADVAEWEREREARHFI